MLLAANMKLVFLHQHFYPEAVGGAVRFTDLASGLAQRGFEITVLTAFPYGHGKHEIRRKEIHQGVTIHRVAKTKFDKNSHLGRAWNGISFFTAAFLKLLTARLQSPLLIGSDPPFLPLLGWLMNKIRGQPYMILVFDIYPDLAVRLGYLKKDGLMTRLWEWLNIHSFMKATVVITPGTSMKEVLQEKLNHTMRGPEIRIIPTWEDGRFIRPLRKEENWFRKKYDLVDKTVALYSGNLGFVHDVVSILEAAQLLKEEREIFFLFIGEGGQKKNLIDLAREKKIQNACFLPYQARDVIPYSLTSGDIALVSMKPEAKGLCLPTKFQTALASGQAIVGIVPTGTEIAEVIESEECGVRVDPGNSEQIAHAILSLTKNPSLLAKYQQNARRTFESRFTMERVIQGYTALFESISQGLPMPAESI